MRSSFFEFSVAQTGLFASKAGMNVVSHNIANRNTAGYSRQVLNQQAGMPIGLNTGKGMVGTGVATTGVSQIRSSFLDQSFWGHNSVYATHSTKHTQLGMISSILNESADVGFSNYVDSFFTSIDKLAGAAGDSTLRNSAIQNALSMTQYFNDSYAALQKQQRDVNNEVKLMVTEINSIASQIQTLNKQIFTSELDGSSANDLRDQRALLVDRLSGFVNVEVTEKDFSTAQSPNDKRFFVSINGFDLVSHFDVNELECRERSVKNNPEDVDGLYDIYFKSPSIKFNTSNSVASLNGELKALLDIRDGNNAESLKGTVYSVDRVPNANGPGIDAIEVTLRGVNRYDMDQEGYVTVNGVRYPYSGFTYTEGPPATATVLVPAQTGKVMVNGKEYDYTLTSFNADTGAMGINIQDLPANAIGKKIYMGGYAVGSVNGIPGSTVTGADFKTTLTAGMGTSAHIGDDVSARGIPYFISKLNTFVRTFARAFNEGLNINGQPITGLNGGHKDAYNLNDGSGNNTGYNFFSYFVNANKDTENATLNYDYTKINAGNFTVASEIVKDDSLLATALDPNPSGQDDNRWLEQFVGIKNSTEVFGNKTIGSFIGSIAGELAVETAHAETFAKSYAGVVNNAESYRLSVMGVEENEEFTMLFAYQQCFNNCAKLINVIDQIYDTTINKLGIS